MATALNTLDGLAGPGPDLSPAKRELGAQPRVLTRVNRHLVILPTDVGGRSD